MLHCSFSAASSRFLFGDSANDSWLLSYKPLDDLFKFFNAAGMWISIWWTFHDSPKDVTFSIFPYALFQCLSPPHEQRASVANVSLESE